MLLGSDFIAQSLVDAGVRNVYGGHGGALVPLVNSVCKHEQLRWICTRNEANASLMAAADSKLTGASRLSACIATSGPGASNLTTGLLDAQLDKVPMIAITGTKPRADTAHSEFQDIDQSRLFAAGGLAYSVTVADPLQLVAVMRDAVAIALTQRVCVHVAVPVDIQGMMIQAPEHLCSASPSAIRKRTWLAYSNPAAIGEVAARLKVPGERIVIAVGLDARGAGAEIVRLAEALDAPIVTRLDAKGVVDESHPLSLGVVGVHGEPGPHLSPAGLSPHLSPAGLSPHLTPAGLSPHLTPAGLSPHLSPAGPNPHPHPDPSPSPTRTQALALALTIALIS